MNATLAQSQSGRCSWPERYCSWKPLRPTVGLTCDISLLSRENAGSGEPSSLLAPPHTFQSYHYEESSTSGSPQSDSDKGAEAAVYLRAMKPGQHFIDTHEYLMPSKTSPPALPANPRYASVCAWMCERGGDCHEKPLTQKLPSSLSRSTETDSAFVMFVPVNETSRSLCTSNTNEHYACTRSSTQLRFWSAPSLQWSCGWCAWSLRQPR